MTFNFKNSSYSGSIDDLMITSLGGFNINIDNLSAVGLFANHSFNEHLDIKVSAIPEPCTYATLLGFASMIVVGMRRIRCRNS